MNELERAAGTERLTLRGMAGYRSLARHTGVELNTVLRHAANGTLAALLPLETRGRPRSAVVTVGRPRPEAGAARAVEQAGALGRGVTRWLHGRVPRKPSLCGSRPLGVSTRVSASLAARASATRVCRRPEAWGIVGVET